MLITSFCMGGVLAIQGVGKTRPAESTATATETTTIPSTVIPTVKPSDTPSLEVTKTSIPETPTPTTAMMANADATATSAQVQPTATITQAPTNSGSSLVVSFIDVGQGDSLLIISPEGQTILIDGGSTDSGVVAYLQRQGIKSIDIMIATHPHEDHIGGLVQVLEVMPVKKVITNGEMYTTSVFEHFLDAIANAKAEYEEVARGDTINFGSLSLDVLSPGSIFGDDPNENSLVLRMSYGKTTFLFTGDAGVEAETSILAAGLPLKATILKVGHHGSCGSSSSRFLDMVKPEVAVTSAGINNQYGLPCTDTIRALNERDIFTLDTGVDGTITVTVSADGYTITNMAGQILRRNP
jgi:competence protein ComEC